MLGNRWVRFCLFALVVGLAVVYVVQNWPAYRRAADTAAGPGTAATNGTGPEAPAGLPRRGVWPAADGDGFFAEFRLNRDRARGAERELLAEVLAAPRADDRLRREAHKRVVEIGRLSALELELENLLRARGFADALVSLTGQSAQVVVSAPDLTPEQAAMVADLIQVVAGIRPEAIRIVPRSG